MEKLTEVIKEFNDNIILNRAQTIHNSGNLGGTKVKMFKSHSNGDLFEYISNFLNTNPDYEIVSTNIFTSSSGYEYIAYIFYKINGIKKDGCTD